MILEKFRASLKQYNLIKKYDSIVIGVSGGPDSVVLLYLLNSIKKEFNLNLHIGHLDHMLRKDSYKDAGYVTKLADKLRIPLTVAQVNIKELAQKGSVEEIARNARLGFLFRVARAIKAKKIALGHNLDDQAETVLMRILRGSGLYGLSAILPKREIAGFEIIRPLIEVRRKEIEAYLRKKRVTPCRDISNLQDLYLRNKIRNRLLPLLEKEYNSNIKEILANMAQSLGYDYDFLQGEAQRRLKVVKHRIELYRLSKFHPAIKRIILRKAFARIKGNTRRLSFAHIKEIEDLVLNRPLNSIVDLPQGISVKKASKQLIFFKR